MSRIVTSFTTINQCLGEVGKAKTKVLSYWVQKMKLHRAEGPLEREGKCQKKQFVGEYIAWGMIGWH
jgi:hypothetical protein